MNKFIPLLLVLFFQTPMATALAQDSSIEQQELLEREVKEEVQEEFKDVKEDVENKIKQEVDNKVKQEVDNKVKQEVDDKVKQEVKDKLEQEVENVLLTKEIPPSTALILLTAILFSSALIGITIYTPSHGIEKQRCDQENLPLTTMDDRTEFVNKVLPKVVEGITVYLIVAVVSILSLSGTIQPQGTITILASISGYVLGRQNQNNANSGTQSKPSSPVNQENNVLETSNESQKVTDKKKVDNEKKSEVNFSETK